MEKDRIYVSKEMATDLFDFFKEKMKINRKESLVCYQGDDEDFGLVYTKNDIGNYELECLNLPYFCHTNSIEDRTLRNVIMNKYEVDIFNHIKGLSVGLNDVVFSMLHEFGHLHQYLTTTDDEFARLTEKYKTSVEKLNSIREEDEIKEGYYREIEGEKYADLVAINLIRKYSDELYEKLKKYNNGDENEEVSPFGDYFFI